MDRVHELKRAFAHTRFPKTAFAKYVFSNANLIQIVAKLQQYLDQVEFSALPEDASALLRQAYANAQRTAWNTARDNLLKLAQTDPALLEIRSYQHVVDFFMVKFAPFIGEKYKLDTRSATTYTDLFAEPIDITTRRGRFLASQHGARTDAVAFPREGARPAHGYHRRQKRGKRMPRSGVDSATFLAARARANAAVGRQTPTLPM